MIGGFSSAPESVIHKLHPFAKMAVGGGFTVYCLFLVNPFALFVLLAFLLAAATTAKIRIPPKRLLGMLIFFTVFAFINFWVSDDPYRALAYCLRLSIFLAAMPIMAATTAPLDMARSLSRLRLPPGIIVALILVWRFFPVMAAQIREMQQAASLRGRAAGGRFTRIYRGFMVPVAFSVVEYSDRVALALEMRGFSPDVQRTCYAVPQFGIHDAVYASLALGAAITAAAFQWGGLCG
jgi:energy-coupling factor transport system permease protein